MKNDKAVWLLMAIAACSSPMTARAQPDHNNAAKADNPAGDAQKIQLRFEGNLKQYLHEMGFDDAATHRAVALYLQDTVISTPLVLGPAAQEFMETARPIVEATNSKTPVEPEKLADELKKYKAARQQFQKHRQKAATDLQQKIRFDQSPRLEATLLLIGVGADVPALINPVVLFWAQPEKLSQLMPTVPPGASPTAWAVYLDPAAWNVRNKFWTRVRVKTGLTQTGFNEPELQGAVLEYVRQKDLARQQLDDAAFALFMNLTPYGQREGQPITEVLTNYKSQALKYQNTMRDLEAALDAKIDFTQQPMLEAVLRQRCGMDEMPTVFLDPVDVDWFTKFMNLEFEK